MSALHLQTSIGMLDGVDVNFSSIVIEFFMEEFCIYVSLLDAAFPSL